MSDDANSKMSPLLDKSCERCEAACECFQMKVPQMRNLGPSELDQLLPIDQLERRQSLILDDQSSAANKFNYAPQHREAVL